MANLKKILRKAQEMELPEQEKHVLTGSKGFFLLQAAGILFTAGLISFGVLRGGFTSAETSMPVYYYVIAGVLWLYGILCLVAAFTCKVTFDDEKITIPGGFPFMTESLEWDNIEEAQLTSIITYRSYLSLVIKRILSSIFAKPELHVERRSPMGMPKANFPVLERVSDTATALCIIQRKLGDRFTVYSKDKE